MPVSDQNNHGGDDDSSDEDDEYDSVILILATIGNLLMLMLWKHIVDKHNGVMERPTFSQFKMDATQFFKSAQRRKANEGVRIASLDPATRMNSCNEFRQGTNIMMRPVRGVGV